MSGRDVRLSWSCVSLILVLLSTMFCSSSRVGDRSSWLGSRFTEPPRALKFLLSFGSSGSGPGQFLHPQGISVDPAGYIYVADTGNHRIQKFDQRGRYLQEIGGFGWGPGQFSSPTGLSAREGLNVYVADSQNRRIQRLDRDLNYLSSIPASEEQEDLDFGFLWDVEVASTGDLFVSDAENEQVWKLTSFGQLDRTFGGFGAAREQLRNPAALALGPGNTIYVADEGNGRIARYDTFGAFSGGLGQDHLRGPRGVAVGPAECLYAADTESDRLCVFGPQGELLFCLGGTGEGPGSFRSPMDVAISRDDQICVVDSGNDRVQMFAVLRQGEPSQP